MPAQNPLLLKGGLITPFPFDGWKDRTLHFNCTDNKREKPVKLFI